MLVLELLIGIFGVTNRMTIIIRLNQVCDQQINKSGHKAENSFNFVICCVNSHTPCSQLYYHTQLQGAATNYKVYFQYISGISAAWGKSQQQIFDNCIMQYITNCSKETFTWHMHTVTHSVLPYFKDLLIASCRCYATLLYFKPLL